MSAKTSERARQQTSTAKAILGNLPESKVGDQAPAALKSEAKENLGQLARQGTAAKPQEDRQALARHLTQEIKRDFRNAILKLRQVHAEKLWQDLGYSGFEEYVLIEFGKTRKWGYQQLNLLRAAECLESKGVTEPLHDLSAEAALVFRRWENRPDVFVLAYQQIIERGDQPTQERLDEECNLQSDYLREADSIGDLTFEEYQAYQRLQGLPYTYLLDKEFATASDLLAACRAEKKKPPLKAIAKLARGADLVAIVDQLEPLGADVAALEALKKRKADLEKAKRDQGQRLLEEIRNLEEQIRQHEPVEGDDEEEDADQGDDDKEVPPPAQEDSPTDLASAYSADPKAFLEDAVVRLELVAEHADDFLDIKEEVLLVLPRASTAAEAIKASLSDESLEPVPVPAE